MSFPGSAMMVAEPAVFFYAEMLRNRLGKFDNLGVVVVAKRLLNYFNLNASNFRAANLHAVSFFGLKSSSEFQMIFKQLGK